jgi:drug/metabolite transporter (DMT)-like permease
VSKKTVSALPILAVLAAAAIGASSGLYIKGLAFSSFAMSSLRMTVPFLLAMPSAARHGLLLGKPGMRGKLFVASGLNAFRLFLYILAYKLTTIGNAVVLLYLWPVFALVIDSVRFRRPLSLAKLGVLVLATAGVAVMNLHRGFSLSAQDLAGSAAMILSAFIFAGTNIMFKQAVSVMSEVDTVYFHNAVGGLVFLPFLLSEISSVPLSHVGVGFIYGAVVGLVGFGLFFVGMKRLPMFQYSALSYSEVPIGVLFGVLFASEALVWNQAAGVALIIAGSFLAQKLRADS